MSEQAREKCRVCGTPYDTRTPAPGTISEEEFFNLLRRWERGNLRFKELFETVTLAVPRQEINGELIEALKVFIEIGDLGLFPTESAYLKAKQAMSKAGAA